MTVGVALPVKDLSFDTSRPIATKGRSTSAVISPCFVTSGSYFSMYMRTVAPTEPVTRESSPNCSEGRRRRGRGGAGQQKGHPRGHTQGHTRCMHRQIQIHAKAKTYEHTRHKKQDTRRRHLTIHMHTQVIHTQLHTDAQHKKSRALVVVVVQSIKNKPTHREDHCCTYSRARGKRMRSGVKYRSISYKRQCGGRPLPSQRVPPSETK